MEKIKAPNSGVAMQCGQTLLSDLLFDGLATSDGGGGGAEPGCVSVNIIQKRVHLTSQINHTRIFSRCPASSLPAVMITVSLVLHEEDQS